MTNKNDQDIPRAQDIYFRVYGIDGVGEVRLGYTSDPIAWTQNSNGWKPEQLRFVPMIRR